MNYDTFIDLVARRAQVPAERAVDLSRATLETLNDRLTAGEALDLAAQLPKPLQGLLRPPDEEADAFGADEFVRRVGDRADVDEAMARDGVRVLFGTLHEAVPGGQFDEVMAELPADYRILLEPVLEPGAHRR